MKLFDERDLKRLYIPSKDSHKGQNGKLLIIGGSHLFHSPSLWALKVASRIVDMVFYSSVSENLELTKKLKEDLYDFIAVPRNQVDPYIKEADAILLGPGLPRQEGKLREEESTRALTRRILSKHTAKTRWVIDAGSLTEMDAEWLKKLNGNVIVTPHTLEFKDLFGVEASGESVSEMAKKYNCIILLKGPIDTVCPPAGGCVAIEGGNPGMTKGGTGDVLAGLIASLACRNELLLAAAAGSFIVKKAGGLLFKKVGPYFNASDLSDEIPKVMKELLHV